MIVSNVRVTRILLITALFLFNGYGRVNNDVGAAPSVGDLHEHLMTNTRLLQPGDMTLIVVITCISNDNSDR